MTQAFMVRYSIAYTLDFTRIVGTVLRIEVVIKKHPFDVHDVLAV